MASETATILGLRHGNEITCGLTVNGKHWKDGRRVNSDLERVYPQEGDSWRSSDTASVNIPCGTSNDTANSEPYDDRDILEEWRTK